MISLRLGFFDWISITTAFLAIVYLQFYSFFASFGFSPRLGLYRWNFTPERASFVVAFAAASVLWLRFKHARLSPHQVHRFSVLLDELSWSERYQELILLIRSNFEQLTNIAKNRVALSRLRRFLSPPPANAFLLAIGHDEEQPELKYIERRPAPVQYLQRFSGSVNRKTRRLALALTTQLLSRKR